MSKCSLRDRNVIGRQFGPRPLHPRFEASEVWVAGLLHGVLHRTCQDC